MGWTSYHATYYKKGKIDRKAEIDNIWNNDNSYKFEVLKSSMVGSTYYGAIHNKETGKVFATIFLTSTNMKEYHNFSYKDMDETCGPYRYDCPVGILKLLSETDYEYANEWRKKCYEKHEQKNAERKKSNSLTNLPVGTSISFNAQIEISGCNVGDKIVLTKRNKCFSNKTYWSDGFYKWSKKLIECVSGGNYTVMCS